MKVARLQQQSRAVGLVGVGNHNGRLSIEAERALEHVSLRGVPVARIAKSGGTVALMPDALFIDAGSLTEHQAQELLITCIEKFGVPPAARDPSAPTELERSAIRKHLQKYRAQFAQARGTQVASLQ